MRNPSLLFLMAILLGLALPARAADVQPRIDIPEQAAQMACPQSEAPDRLAAETSLADCCKGHKGVCGCRAGKIVCCDGTASATCTCHGEDGWLN